MIIEYYILYIIVIKSMDHIITTNKRLPIRYMFTEVYEHKTNITAKSIFLSLIT